MGCHAKLAWASQKMAWVRKRQLVADLVQCTTKLNFGLALPPEYWAQITLRHDQAKIGLGRALYKISNKLSWLGQAIFWLAQANFM